jgi:hypothetical protein
MRTSGAAAERLALRVEVRAIDLPACAVALDAAHLVDAPARGTGRLDAVEARARRRLPGS